jgi:hypothetical protein
MPVAQRLDTVLDTEHLSAEEVSNMLAWTKRMLLIPICAVLMFWAFSSIAIWATEGIPPAGHTAPVVVPSPERPCVASDVPRAERPCVAPSPQPATVGF